MNCTLPSGDFLRSVSMANRHFKRAKKTKKAIMKKAFYQKIERYRFALSREKKSIEKAREYVKIFTTEKIKDDEILLLSIGLKYLPSPSTKFAKSSIASDFNEFARKLRCKYHFDKGEIFKRHPFLTKSGYEPVMQEVTAKQRKDTLMVKPKSVLQWPPLVFSTVFSRQKSHVKNNILNQWDTLKDDEEANILFYLIKDLCLLSVCIKT
ncbi:unnamed protein product [Mytilus edulis]|uniref:Uncharacterized protein n=1 Tax=Mytilus edulis TaxID=6550 RepID=A0A8S3QWN7_MYTED|nr:unnamed protein product [Mytilus edulis]